MPAVLRMHACTLRRLRHVDTLAHARYQDGLINHVAPSFVRTSLLFARYYMRTKVSKAAAKEAQRSMRPVQSVAGN